ncbi:MAG: hypothetical protein DI582_02050 [Azospirillum brasilense]|nr:MAG: hypothetical protein DI582_02050 [Azospirillum brasilense]
MAKFDVQSPAAEAGQFFEEMVGQMHLAKHGPQIEGLADVMKQFQASMTNFTPDAGSSMPSLKDIAAAKGGGVER